MLQTRKSPETNAVQLFVYVLLFGGVDGIVDLRGPC